MKSIARSAAIAVSLLGLPSLAQAQQPTSASGDPVKIGLLLDMSSLYADVTGAGSETAARMAAEDFGGTVLGRPIQVLVADTQSKPDIAVTTARRWFDTENVVALMEVTGTSAALAVMQVANDKNHIIVLNGPGTTSITNESCTPVSVHWTFDTHALAYGTATRVVQDGGKTWFILAADYNFGDQMTTDATKIVISNGGKVLGSVKVPLLPRTCPLSCCKHKHPALRWSASPMPAQMPSTR